MIDQLLYFIKERHSIYLKRERGLPKPWSSDPIFQTYKFCNVYRELDRVTIWIRENIREPFADHPNLWFMLCIARRINWPDTLRELIEDKKAWPLKAHNPERMIEVLDDRTAKGEQIYTGAYMITAEHSRQGETGSYTTAVSNLGRLWGSRKEITPHLNGTLDEAFYAIKGKGYAWGQFMTAQVIADLKHTRYLENAPDYWTWAASGPGSRRGLNRVLGRGVGNPWNEEEWKLELGRLSKEVTPYIEKLKYPRLCNQNLQNVLCEFDKYQRVKRGEGRPRSLYKGI